MTHRIAHAVFVVSLVIALLGGVLLIAWQALGLVTGNGDIVTAPNGMFKTILCIAASIASVAAYVLVHVTGPRPAPQVPVDHGDMR